MCTTGDVQFSIGEQSEEIRKKFWATGYKICPKCQSQNIAVHYWSCGCRFNGDGHSSLIYLWFDDDLFPSIFRLGHCRLSMSRKKNVRKICENWSGIKKRDYYRVNMDVDSTPRSVTTKEVVDLTITKRKGGRNHSSWPCLSSIKIRNLGSIMFYLNIVTGCYSQWLISRKATAVKLVGVHHVSSVCRRRTRVKSRIFFSNISTREKIQFFRRKNRMAAIRYDIFQFRTSDESLTETRLWWTICDIFQLKPEVTGGDVGCVIWVAALALWSDDRASGENPLRRLLSRWSWSIRLPRPPSSQTSANLPVWSSSISCMWRVSWWSSENDEETEEKRKEFFIELSAIWKVFVCSIGEEEK